MSLTERQARAARAAAGVAVTAGAGTGKTHTLGHRYLTHLQEGLSPLSIVAVTFTERAAHELRARVRSYARDAFPPNDDRLVELEAAPIGTVHGLCLRICRDHPGAAGVPHDVTVLDPLEGGVWAAERLASALRSVPASLYRAMPYERVRDVLAALLADPYGAEAALAHGPDGWPDRVREAREEARRQHLHGTGLGQARALLQRLQGPAGDKGEQARLAALAAMRAVDADDPETALDRVRSYRRNVGARATWGARQEDLRAATGAVKDAVQAWHDDPRSRLALGPADDAFAALLPELRRAWRTVRDRLQEAKQGRRVVDFADLEVHALRALRDDGVLAHYRARWRALLVDEVQDTSPVQEAIIARLSTIGRTTIVGDPKQSIYGFRGADAAVFRALSDRIREQGGTHVELDTSFRTHRALAGATEPVFASLLGELHAPLDARRAETPGPGPYLRRLVLSEVRGVPAPLRRLAEARRIAGEIRAMIERRLPVHDPAAPGGVRPLRAGDVAVLSRSWAPLDLLAEILPAHGVPAVHGGGGDLLATREAMDGEAALRFLADPDDDVALVALLRAPFFALPDTVLPRLARAVAAMREQDDGDLHPVSWWRSLQRSAPAEAARAVRVLEPLVRARGEDPPSRLLARLDRDTGWSAVVANLPGGPRRSADLEGFLALVRELERGTHDPFTVARRLRRLRAAGAEVDRPALEAGDAVTLTTIHRSKGLEWPVVLVVALDAPSAGGAPPLRIDPGAGVALRLDDDTERNAAPALWQILAARDAQREEAENRRILYVALTRAQDRVLVSSAGGRGPLIDLLDPALDRAGVAEEARAFRAADAVWPSAPRPDPVPTGDGDLWRPADAGDAAAGVVADVEAWLVDDDDLLADDTA